LPAGTGFVSGVATVILVGRVLEESTCAFAAARPPSVAADAALDAPAPVLVVVVEVELLQAVSDTAAAAATAVSAIPLARRDRTMNIVPPE